MLLQSAALSRLYAHEPHTLCGVILRNLGEVKETALADVLFQDPDRLVDYARTVPAPPSAGLMESEDRPGFPEFDSKKFTGSTVMQRSGGSINPAIRFQAVSLRTGFAPSVVAQGPGTRNVNPDWPAFI